MRRLTPIRQTIDGLRETAGRVLGTLLLLALLLTAFVRDLRQFPGSFTWPSTQGQVVDAAYIQDDTFSIEFAYTYQVDGTTYHGERITFFQYAVFANGYQNRRFIERHRPGTPVTVYYDPRDPGQSVLMRTIPLTQLWSPLLLLLCLLTILLSAVAGLLLRLLLRAVRRRLSHDWPVRGDSGSRA